MESRLASDRSSEPYDIFAGHSDQDAKWIELVTGLKKARERMRQIADEKPGDYFLLNADAGMIVERVSTKREG